MNAALTPQAVLQLLTRARIVEVGRVLHVPVPEAPKDKQIAALLEAAHPLPQLLAQLGRDELKSLCRKSGLPDEGRSRRELVDRLLSATGLTVQRPQARARELPAAGDIVQVRQREYLVEEVRAGTQLDDATWVELSCLDDDAQGRRVGVLWELELGARMNLFIADDVGLGKTIEAGLVIQELVLRQRVERAREEQRQSAGKPGKKPSAKKATGQLTILD